MKNLKNFTKTMCVAFVLFLLIGISADTYGATYPKWMDVTAEAKSKTQVKLSWKAKKSVQGYDIFRVQGDEFNSKKSKLIKSVSKKKTSYTDKVKYKKNYWYQVRAYKIKNGKKVYTYCGEAGVYTGVGKTEWEESLRHNAKITPESIRLEFYSNGLRQTGYEIYRKTGTQKFEKIKTLKTKKAGMIYYTDKNVKTGSTYRYKVRAYKVIDGKKVYGKYSEQISLSAVRKKGNFKVEVLMQPDTAVETGIMSIESESGNAVTILGGDYDDFTYSAQHATNEDVYTDVEFKLLEYSYDNITWQKYTEEIHLGAGEKIYIKFIQKGEDGKAWNYSVQDMKTALFKLGVVYNGLYSDIYIDMKKNTVEMRVNLEYYE